MRGDTNKEKLRLFMVALGRAARESARVYFTGGGTAIAFGWRESTVGARTFDVLPDAARAYLDRLEALIGVPIAMVSTGADRDETILRQHPFS